MAQSTQFDFQNLRSTVPSKKKLYSTLVEEESHNTTKFSSLSDNHQQHGDTDQQHSDTGDLLKFVRESIIGKDAVFQGPFGPRKITFCDYTASGRALACFEDYIRDEVLPLYANTHSTSSVTGHQSTLFRFEARQLIGHTVNARHDKDVVLFSGRGVTGALHHLIQILMRSYDFTSNAVVFVGPYEHHSTLLPWREIGCKVIMIKEDESGRINESHLEEELKSHATWATKIGCFSAASNVTGILTDTNAISIMLHKYGALALWDYASAGPYVNIDMNPYIEGPSRELVHKDAIFISTHKFIGGPGTPGILVIKKSLINKKASPTIPGGGTIFYVTEHDHRFLSNLCEREEGGTPDIVGSIRAGLVFQLKHAIGTKIIEERETYFFRRALDRFSSHPNIHILGPKDVPRLAIISFIISHQSGRFLHYNFVCALLNDLFGIQTRGGCMCAGPYSQHLLGIDYNLAKEFESQLVERGRGEVIRPGFVRLNLNYFISEEEFDFIVSAVEFIAEKGWKFLPQYTFFEESNEWVHLKNKKFSDRRWLDKITYKNGKMQWPNNNKGDPIMDLKAYLDDAEKLADAVILEDQHPSQLLHDSAEKLRWFVYPNEAFTSRMDFLETTNSSGKTAHMTDKLLALGCQFVPHEYFPSSPEKIIAHENFPEKIIGPHEYFPEKIIGKYQNISEGKQIFPILPKEDKPTCVSCISEKEKNIKPQNSRTLEDPVSKGSDFSPTDNLGKSKVTEEDQKSQLGLQGSDEDGPPTPVIKNEEFNLVTPDSSLKILSKGFSSQPIKSKPTRKGKVQEKKPLNPKHAILQEKKKISRSIFALAVEAIQEFSMIKDGDRVLVGLSGGKDSLTLLHILIQLRQSKKLKFDLGATTVDPQTISYDPSPLIPYLKGLGVPYYYESQGLIERAKEQCPTSICAWCSRMKRGILCQTARKYGYNRLALGQHLDDLAESFLMHAFHNGKLDTMRANSLLKEGDLSIIRPFLYVRELQTKKYAKLHDLPVITENCPACFSEPKERRRIKALLAAQETLFPNLFNSIRSALHPLMHGRMNLKEMFAVLMDEDVRGHCSEGNVDEKKRGGGEGGNDDSFGW